MANYATVCCMNTDKTLDPVKKMKHSESRRAQLISTARKLFEENGPEAVTMMAVARIAGVDRVTVHRYFETREKLLLEVTNELVKEVGIPTSNRLDVDSVDDFTNQIVEHFVEQPERARAWLLQLVSSTQDSAGEQLLEREIAMMKMLSTSEFAKKNIDTEVLAVILLAGTLLWSVHAHDVKKMSARAATRQFIQEVKRLLLHGAIKEGLIKDPLKEKS